jgi:putative PIN family toxin of toxin-antitoxin system
VIRRAAFDTNVPVSGYLWKGLARRAIEKVRRGEWILLISDATTEELIRVLAYEKFGLRPQEIEPIILDLLSISEMVEVTSPIDAIKTDPTDNIFLALAGDGEGDAIVSGDRHLLDLGEFRGIPILRIREFVFQKIS